MSVKSLVFSAALALSALASGAQAGTITFDSATPGLFVFGTVTEDGFDYTVQTGALYANQYGNPGADMEGSEELGGGVLDIVATDGSLFTFTGLDYAAWSSSAAGSQILTIRGFLGGIEQGVEGYNLANTATFVPSYTNWTGFSASGLSGVTIDTLSIELNAGEGYFQAIDNVQLSAVPEPATWATMIVGFGLAGAALRRRRLTIVA